MWLFELFFPEFCKSDMLRYGYLEVFQRVPWNSNNESRLYFCFGQRQYVWENRYTIIFTELVIFLLYTPREAWGVDNRRVWYCYGRTLCKVIGLSNAIFPGLLNVKIKYYLSQTNLVYALHTLCAKRRLSLFVFVFFVKANTCRT